MHSKKPVIGITLNEELEVANYRWPSSRTFDYLNKAYHYAIEKSGGLPIGLFNTMSKSAAGDYLDKVDGLVLTGGPDVESKLYGQAQHHTSSQPTKVRDRFELDLIEQAMKRKLPIFCICRGHQLLNVASGGDLYQDLKLIGKKTVRHKRISPAIDADHQVTLNEDTLLYKLIKAKRITVNSSHHQTICNLGRGLKIAATSADGVIEAVELADYPFLLSVQWHPERIIQRAHARKLFTAFIAVSKSVSC
jgi:putative glutamine amidotransferase